MAFKTIARSDPHEPPMAAQFDAARKFREEAKLCGLDGINADIFVREKLEAWIADQQALAVQAEQEAAKPKKPRAAKSINTVAEARAAEGPYQPGQDIPF